MIKRLYYRLFYKRYCFKLTLSERFISEGNHQYGHIWWDDIYLKKGWWFREGQYQKDKRWKKHPLNPTNHDCWLNSIPVVLTGASWSPNSPTIYNEEPETYYICNICGKRLEHDNRKNQNRIDSGEHSQDGVRL